MRYESAYERELEERDRLRSGAGISIGVITVLGSALGAMIRSRHFDTQPWNWIYWSTCGAGIVSFLWVTFCVAMTFRGHIYKAIPPSRLLRNVPPGALGGAHRQRVRSPKGNWPSRGRARV